MERTDHQHHRTLSQIQDLIQSEDDFLITSHIHPDGDSIASVLVLASILKQSGKRYQILLDDYVPKKFDFLSGVDEVLCVDDASLSYIPRVLIILDSSNLERIGRVQKVVPKNIPVINIDHHLSNESFGTLNLVNSEESSTVEIVYDLYTSMDIPFSAEVASCIYTGILCDTGRFLFPNTTSRSLAICSEMIEYGASPDTIADKLYFRMSHDTIRALASALSTLEFYFNGTVSCIYLANGAFTGSDKVDTEGFVDFLLAIDKTEVEFLMVEKEPNLFRISFRSKNKVDVNEVAKHFGGGGHTRASGCTLNGTVGDVKQKILDVLEDYL